MRNYVLGRLARWSEIGLTKAQVVYHSIRLLADLYECKWRHRDFSFVFHTSSGKPMTPELRTFHQILRLLLKGGCEG